MTLIVYNVKKLHGPRMSDGFLADCVDTTLASTTAAVFSELHDQLASLGRHNSWHAVFLR